MTHDEAIIKNCILGLQSPRIRSMQPGSFLPPCIGMNCVAYWRWLNSEKTDGYCSLGVKPEF